MLEYHKQLEQGSIQLAYKGLMEYMMGLRAHFASHYPEYSVPGTIYYGTMDMTYFSVVPPSLKDRKLKIAIVFLHEAFRFEAWLSGYNRQVQKDYWHIFKTYGWDLYRLVTPAVGVDSILEHPLAENPDFGDLPLLTQRIENGTLTFIKDVENFLSTLS